MPIMVFPFFMNYNLINIINKKNNYSIVIVFNLIQLNQANNFNNVINFNCNYYSLTLNYYIIFVHLL